MHQHPDLNRGPAEDRQRRKYDPPPLRHAEAPPRDIPSAVGGRHLIILHRLQPPRSAQLGATGKASEIVDMSDIPTIRRLLAYSLLRRDRRKAGGLAVAAAARVIAPPIQRSRTSTEGARLPRAAAARPAGRRQYPSGGGQAFAHPTRTPATPGSAQLHGPPTSGTAGNESRAGFVRTGDGPTRDHHEQRRRVID
ncbi:MAG: hypothetical protein V7646_792 [Pseudonocardia sp.]|jgi:hypothetical protein